VDAETQKFMEEQYREHLGRMASFEQGVYEMKLQGREKDIYDTDQMYNGLLEQLEYFHDMELMSDEEYAQLKKDLKLMHTEDLLAIDEYYLEEKKKKDKQAADFQREQNKQALLGTLKTYSDFAGSLGAMMGEQSAEFKALASFQTLVNTYAAAVAAYKSALEIPVVGSFMAPVAAASAVLYGMARVREINATKKPAYEFGGETLSYPHQAQLAEQGAEYVVPNWLRQDPQVAAYENMIEARRATGPSSVTNITNTQGIAAGGSDPAMVSAIEKNNTLMEQLLRDGVKSVWEWDDFKRGRDEMETIEEEAKIS
jgi:hypothetical protein